MAIQSQPSRIPQPFAGSGTKNTIPATNATPSASQAASWASGFPPECSQPISAGGCPVPRNDVNGALNQLSQDFAFRQDGGIWEWSALADYDTQRMVRGSDGLLYWSVAQSGPGFGAGAIDPTTDDGTHWSSPALKTMPLADKSAMGATTEWVKNLANATLYVDASAASSGDGFTPETAVKTIGEAVALLKTVPDAKHSIYIKTGTYSENVTLTSQNVVFVIQGDVFVNGALSISDNGVCHIYTTDNSYTLSFTASSSSVLNINSSNLYVHCLLSLNCSNTDSAIQVKDNSFLKLDNPASIYCDGISYSVIDVYNVSNAHFQGLLTVSGSGCFRGVSSEAGSNVLFASGVQSSVVFSECALRASLSGSIYVRYGDSSLHSGASALAVVVATLDSYIEFLDCNITIKKDNSSSMSFGVISEKNSLFSVDISGKTATFDIGTSYGAIECRYGGQVNLWGSGTIVFAGTYSWATIDCYNGSFVAIDSALTLSGTPTGMRFSVHTLSNIHAGGGQNRIPGTINGSVTSSDFGVYS